MEPRPHHLEAADRLAHGDALGALNAIAGDEDGHAHALRGIALAQLEELDAAQRELRLAAQTFEDHPLYHARALAALAEVSAARREIGTALDALATAADRLAEVGDRRNAAWMRLVRVRLLVLIGALSEARAELATVAEGLAADPKGDPVLRSTHGLARASVAIRELETEDALAALDQALTELTHSDDGAAVAHPLLSAELEAHRGALTRPVARRTLSGRVQRLTVPELATVFAGSRDGAALAKARAWWVIDAIAGRFGRAGEDLRDLASRAVPFALLVELGRVWPEAMATDTLIARVFGGPPDDESYRDRCRVEIDRLRRLLPSACRIDPAGRAWRLVVPNDESVVVVELEAEGDTLTALLADGQPWAARDLALAIGASQRSVQRSLRSLVRRGEVESVGRARAQRWVSTRATSGIATQMFLVSLLAPVETEASNDNPRRKS